MIDPAEASGRTDYRVLAERMGRDVLEKRIFKQAGLWAREVHQGQDFSVSNGLYPWTISLLLALKCLGPAGWGRRNFLDVQIVENEVVLAGLLQEAFEGFRLLQLADLHCGP